ncbi:unnamed protein product [Nezara viridula]|uniref:t-SNARE coiled-coil homology domain-containing protein n=1 Tax=Nezara viridula TaxID=85310 RepID=A0A9P0H3F0_NEZVI|nr:unnamed protein product [Nezara viridula]
MTTRSLTDIFILMRNNASQTRNMYADQGLSDRSALVPMEDDIELGRVPPSWSSMVEESQFTLMRLKSKLATLKDLYANLISRPAFDDNDRDEQEIKSLTEDIMRMSNGLCKIAGKMEAEGRRAVSPLERRLLQSVTRAMVTEMSTLQAEFKAVESNYVNMVKSREERSKFYFDFETETSEEDWGEINLVQQSMKQRVVKSREERSKPYFDFETETVEEDWGEINLVQQSIEQRGVDEKQVENIMRSFVELRDLYLDLSRLIVDQGTILDRIDYHVEQAQNQISRGTQKIAKAAQYQKSHKKLFCIFILAVTFTVLFIALIVIKL